MATRRRQILTPEQRERKRAAQRAYYRRTKAVRREQIKKWQKAHPESLENSRLKYRFGLTSRDREFLHKLVGGICPICRHREAVCVDHDHSRGHVRGLLCTRCNFGLGHFDDDIQTLRRAMAYLEMFL